MKITVVHQYHLMPGQPGGSLPEPLSSPSPRIRPRARPPSSSSPPTPRGAATGRRGRRWVLEHATRESLARRYLGVMEELVGA